MTLARRTLLRLPALAASGLAGAALAQGAAPAPSPAPSSAPSPGAMPYVSPVVRPRSVTLLVGAAGSSGTDLWVRGFAPFLERHLKQVQVQVVNRVGEGGLAVMRDLAEARADGSVLAYAATPSLLARAVERNATAVLGRIALVGAVTAEPVALVAPPGTELAALRARPDGRPLGLPPPFTPSALAALELAQSLPMEQLHFPSAAAARQAAIAGNVAAALVTLPETVAAVREGRLALLGLAAPARHPQFPDVPTLREEGWPVEAQLRRGLAAPAGIAPEALARIARALRAAAADPEFLAQAEGRAILPQFLDAEAWNRRVTEDLAELRSRWETTPWKITGG